MFGIISFVDRMIISDRIQKFDGEFEITMITINE